MKRLRQTAISTIATVVVLSMPGKIAPAAIAGEFNAAPSLVTGLCNHKHCAKRPSASTPM